MFKVIEKQNAFYFSYQMDLTKRIQTIVTEKLAAA
jgi:hypothetical protein